MGSKLESTIQQNERLHRLLNGWNILCWGLFDSILMGRRGLSDLQDAMKTIYILTVVAILQFYTLVTQLSKGIPKIPRNCFSVCGDQIFSWLGYGVQILAHTQARRRQSWVVFSLSSSIGIGRESFNLATLNRKT